jgi:hypothetical protein
MLSRLPLSLFSTSLIGGALFVAFAGLVVPQPAAAQDKQAKPAKQASVSAKKSPPKQAKRSTKKEPEAASEVHVAAADEKQLLAAKEVHMGESGCEFGQKIKLDANAKHPGYVDLSYNKKTYTMRPVMSATGALRLEDVRSEALMIQIASKSMLMNQKTGQRLVDNCVHPDQKTVTAGTSSALIGK